MTDDIDSMRDIPAYLDKLTAAANGLRIDSHWD
jgi:hypothetical protein